MVRDRAVEKRDRRWVGGGGFRIIRGKINFGVSKRKMGKMRRTELH